MRLPTLALEPPPLNQVLPQRSTSNFDRWNYCCCCCLTKARSCSVGPKISGWISDAYQVASCATFSQYSTATIWLTVLLIKQLLAPKLSSSSSSSLSIRFQSKHELINACCYYWPAPKCFICSLLARLLACSLEKRRRKLLESCWRRRTNTRTQVELAPLWEWMGWNEMRWDDDEIRWDEKREISAAVSSPIRSTHFTCGLLPSSDRWPPCGTIFLLQKHCLRPN